MIQALWWWLVVQVVVLCALPMSLALFHPLADRGYGLAKAFGLLLFGYVAWLLASTPLLWNGQPSGQPNGWPVLFVALGVVVAGSAIVLRRGGGAGLADLVAFWHRRRGLLLLEEALFLVAFLGFLAIRRFNPEIAGTEKFMDFAFVNAVTRSAHFPPLDPWLAPSAAIPVPVINYYYLGYLIQGLLLELANVIPGAVPPAVAFNLALGLLLALAATGCFSLGYGLARDLVAEPAPGRAGPRRRAPRNPAGAGIAGAADASAGAGTTAPPGRRASGPVWSLRAAWPYVVTGLLAAFLLLVAGNLWTALRLVDGSGMWQRDFWQGIGWNATRVLVIKDGDRDVDYTINEFPAFSFLLGDLHPHVLALPFVLVAVGLAYRWLMAPPRLYRWAVAGEPLGGRREAGGAVAELLPGGLVLGALYFMNSWDFPAYFLLAQAGALGGALWQWRRQAPLPSPLAPAGRVGRAVGVVVLGGVIALAAVAPFLLTFRPPVLTEGGRLPLGLVVQRSHLDQFFQFWGAQLLLLLPAVLAAMAALGLPQVVQRVLGRSLSSARATAIVVHETPGWEPALFLGGGVLLVLLAERLQAGSLLLALLLAGSAGWVAWRALTGGPAGMGRPLAFAAGAIALAALLLVACEVVYVRDFYGGSLRRMNTVFKLYYQAWLLFAIGSSVAVFWLLRRLHRRRDEPGGRLAWATTLGAGALLLVAMVLFPIKATLLRTNDFRNQPTLNGMAWLEQAQPEDYHAAEWLRLNGRASAGQRAPVLLEATGGAYSEFGRLASQTGFPTVLGWDQHERLWRGAGVEAEIGTRQRDVDTMYGAATLQQTRPLLDTYNVTYVVIGYLERQKYGASGGLAKFDAGGLAPVFREGGTVIYRVDRAAPARVTP